jgi:protein arginine kinase
MRFHAMANVTSRWLKGDGPEAGIVFSSRVRLARNLGDSPFPPWAEESKLKGVSEKVIDAIEKSKYLKNAHIIDMAELSPVERRFLFERHLISVEFTKGGKYRFLATEKEEMVSLMINEEDHLRLQTIFSGLQLTEAWRLIDRVDDELEGTLDYAFLPQYGYLTACPTNTGTGMRASCMLHLPALVAVRKINDILKGISQLGLVARGLYGEGTEAQGEFFQVSNQLTLGLKEEEIIDHVQRVTHQVVEQEKRARKALLKRNGLQIRNEVGRAYGVLTGAYLISSQEALDLLSKLRLGISLKLLPGLNIGILNELFFLITPAQLQIRKGRELASLSRDELRAKLIRGKLSKVR